MTKPRQQAPRPEFHVTIRVKNNRLLSRRREYKMSQKRMAEALRIGFKAYVDLENMTSQPLDKGGGIRSVARALMNFWDVPFEELWPDCILRVEESRAVREMYAEEIAQVLHAPRTLRPDAVLEAKEQKASVASVWDRFVKKEGGSRAAAILDAHYREGRTLEDIAKDMQVSRERVRQIERKGLRQLRHPRYQRRLQGDDVLDLEQHIIRSLRLQRHLYNEAHFWDADRMRPYLTWDDLVQGVSQGQREALRAVIRRLLRTEVVTRITLYRDKRGISRSPRESEGECFIIKEGRLPK